MDEDTTFASRTVRAHLLRGAVGLPLLVAAFALIPAYGAGMLLLAPVGVFFLRGCPTCWALGLTQTKARVARENSSQPTVPSSQTTEPSAVPLSQ